MTIDPMAWMPTMWSTLSKELLHPIFTRHHVAGIAKICMFSKEWKSNVNSKDSDSGSKFSQIFD